MPISKRGRPRISNSSDGSGYYHSDERLIQEYMKRSAFYDRNHEHYRKREFIKPLWRDLARSVGMSAVIAKNRLSQLKSRYALEKRRIDAKQITTSHWPLYEAFSALGRYIKHRPSLPSGAIIPANDENIRPSVIELNRKKNSPVYATRISDMSIDEMLDTSRESAGTSKCNQVQNVNGINTAFKEIGQSPCGATPVSNLCSYCKFCSFGKFGSFGKFIADSLSDMDENKALLLVDKFTSEVVRSTIAQGEHTANHMESTTDDIIDI